MGVGRVGIQDRVCAENDRPVSFRPVATAARPLSRRRAQAWPDRGLPSLSLRAQGHRASPPRVARVLGKIAVEKGFAAPAAFRERRMPLVGNELRPSHGTVPSILSRASASAKLFAAGPDETQPVRDSSPAAKVPPCETATCSPIDGYLSIPPLR